MNEQLQLIRRYVRMVWPYRWSALGLTIVVCLSGWFFALNQPNIYEVNAKIFVDTRSMLRPLLRGLAVESDTLASSASLMKRTLLTRPNLEAVARKTDLDLKSKTDRDFDLLVTHLAEKIKLEGTTQDNIYEIAYTDSNTQQAKRIVDELLNTFMESALGSNRKDTAATQKFLNAQIGEYENRLLEAEQRLKEFKQKNIGQMPEEGGGYYVKLQRAKEVLQQADLQLQEAQNRGSILRQQLAGEEPVLGIGNEQQAFKTLVSSQYDGRIAKLQDQLDQLLLQYTDKHPDIVAIRQQMGELERRRDDEMKQLATEQEAAPTSRSDGTDRAASGVYQEIKLAMAEADAEVAGLTARAHAYRKAVEDLEHAVDTIPEVEAELTRLNRDYALNRQQYDELIKRRESARLSQEVDQQGDDIKLKIIEPPRIPLRPIGPKRIQLMSMVLLGGLGAGVGLAFLLSQVNPRFYSTEELKEVTQLPVLGAITLVFSQRQRTERQMELAVFAAVLLGLVSFYGGLVTLELLDFNLNAKISGLLGAPA